MNRRISSYVGAILGGSIAVTAGLGLLLALAREPSAPASMISPAPLIVSIAQLPAATLARSPLPIPIPTTESPVMSPTSIPATETPAPSPTPALAIPSIAPDFTLAQSGGGTFVLTEQLAQGPVVLVFFQRGGG
jgi:hypothetical protein